MEETQENEITNYGYTYTALKPSIVSHSTAGSFLGVGETNLIVAKNAHIEVFTLEENQLHLQHEIGTFLRIRKLMTIKTMFPIDLLFIVLDMYFVIASFDFETKELRLLYSKKMLSRDETDRPDLLFALYNSPEPSKRFDIGFSVDGVMTLLQFEADLVFTEGHGLTGTISGKSHDFTIEAGCDIIDMVFMDGGNSAAFITREAASRAVAVKTYEIDIEHSTLLPGTISGTTNDTTTCFFVPVPIQGGVITIGLKEINYFKPTGKKMISFGASDVLDDVEDQHCFIKACSILDTNLFLYGDAASRWYLIQLERDKGGEVSKMNRIELGTHGELNYCTKVTKIQHDHVLAAYVVFTGIAKTDAQLATIIPTNPTDQRVEIEAKYNSFYATNVVLNESDPQCTTIVGCSDRNNYLNILKNGASITEFASFEQNNVKAVWGVKKHAYDEYHLFLVFSFVGHTRILRAQQDVTEVTIDSINPNIETIYIGNADHDLILHVTVHGAALLNSEFKLVSEWKVPSGVITAAEATPSQLTVAQGKKLYQFNITEQGLSLQATSTQPDDIAYIIYDKDEKSIGKAILVALWQSNIVQCMDVSSLQNLSKIQVNEPDGALIRCLALKNSDLMVGLGDGRVLHYHYDSDTHIMTKQKSFQIGTTQARCVSVDMESNNYFFVCTDRPSLIISDEFGLRVVPVNSTSPIWFVCPFKFEYLDDWGIVACSSSEVKIISMDNVQKLHATKFDLKEYTPYDVDRFAPNNVYAVISSKNGGAYINLVNIDLPSDHPQNQYAFTIDPDAEPLCICHLTMKNPTTGQVADFLGAIVYSEQNSTMALYKVDKNKDGISVISEVQSIQFENRVLKMKCYKNMAILCCTESMILVNFNANGDLDFAAEFHGLFFHNITVDNSSGLIVPLSLSTEIEFFEVHENNSHVEIKQLDMDQGIGYKCIDLPLKVAFLNGEHKQVVAGTMQGRLQFFFGPSNKRTHKIDYNISDAIAAMHATKNNTVVYTTQSGAVGVCKLISKEDHRTLQSVQMRLSHMLHTLLPISHDELRFNYSAIEDDEYSPQSFLHTNLIDGDFVMKYLTLRKEQKEQIDKEMNMNVTEFIQKFHEGLLFI